MSETEAPEPAPYGDGWLKIKDMDVIHKWSCDECGSTAFVGPEYYAESGTPVCEECDGAMTYVETRIREKA